MRPWPGSVRAVTTSETPVRASDAVLLWTEVHDHFVCGGWITYVPGVLDSQLAAGFERAVCVGVWTDGLSVPGLRVGFQHHVRVVQILGLTLCPEFSEKLLESSVQRTSGGGGFVYHYMSSRFRGLM